ncbi:zinc-binding dehydrogenase [Cupriavidus sp. USMAHM13]|nr:zinc-binding dehydrogenase [Cupriavidus sp. USMAHM13]
MVARGAFRPVVGRVLPLSEAGQAMAHLGGRKTFGKVVVKP